MPVTAHRFVIRPRDPDGQAAPLPHLGPALPVQPLAGARNAWVTEARGHSIETAWRKLQRQLGGQFQALPVLSDPDSGERYPTGRIGVRFRAPVSDTQLQHLATAAGAQLLHRTPRTDRQAVFTATDPAAQYAPALVERLAEDDSVDRAWLDAESAYRRSS